MLLKPDENFADTIRLANLGKRIAKRLIPHPQQRRQFVLIQLFHALRHVLRQHKIDEGRLAILDA